MLRTARPPRARGKSKLAGRQRPFVSDPPHPARTLTAIPPSTWMEGSFSGLPPHSSILRFH